MNNEHWQNGTNALKLQYLAEKHTHEDEFPEDKYDCIQMMYRRAHLYAQLGYTQYIYEWPADKLPKNYKLSEIVDLLREYFVGCEITYTENSSVSTDNNSETYKLESCVITIDWSPKEEEDKSDEEDYDEKWKYREFLEQHYSKKYGF